MTRPGKQQQAKPRTDALDQAARHLRANKLDAALEVYQQLYDQEPEDWTVANALGDLHVRMNNTDDAIEVFMSLAEHMAEQGHSPKARALYRKVLRMRPNHDAATARVAELENANLDASPFMQRVRGALLDAQTTAPAAAPALTFTPAPQAPAVVPEPDPEPLPRLDLSALSFAPQPVPLSTPDPIPLAKLDAIPLWKPDAIPVAKLEPIPLSTLDPIPVAWQEPIAVAKPAAIPVARPEPRAESFAPIDAFEPGPDGWVEDGMALAAAPLYDSPSSAVNPSRLGAYQRTEAAVRHAVASGDFHGAKTVGEQFLRAYPNDVDTLEMLVHVGVDGRLDDTERTQIRLADACLTSGRVSSGRHVALDLLHRLPGDPAVTALVDRVLQAGGFARSERDRPVVELPNAAFADEAVELFDDDGLVTDEGRRSTTSAAGPSHDADPLAGWLDASDESDARATVIAAMRMAAAGNAAGAMAALEPLMRTPALRPIVGVQLAQIYRREGDHARALHCLEQAAEQPPVHADNAHALAYELALTLEVMGQRNSALAIYRELMREVGPTFRDVAARAEHLSAA